MHEDTKRGFALSLFFHIVLLFLVGLFVLLNQSQISLGTLKSIWSAWDGSTYLYLAEHGYTYESGRSTYIAFYPLYPVLLRVLSAGIIDLHLTAVALTLLGSLVGHTAFFVFLRERGLERLRAERILLLFFLCPATVYFTLICTEGIFLAWVSLFFLCLYRRQFGFAVLFGLLASMTRMPGITLIVPYLLYFFEQGGWRKEWKSIVLFPVISLGFCLYLWINWQMFADPFYYRIVLQENWHKAIVNPLTQYWGTLRSITTFFPTDLPTYALDRITTLASPIIVMLYILKKRKESWWPGIGFSLANISIIASQSYWLSNTRYVSLILPLYLFLEEITGRYRTLYWMLCILFGSVSVFGIYVFSSGGWLY